MASASRRILTPAIAAVSRTYKHSSPSVFSASHAPPIPTSPLLFRSVASPISAPSWQFRSWSFATAAQTPIKVGDRLPDGTLSYIDSAGNVQTVSMSDLAAGKKIVLFAVPGAFTPTCSQKHLPEFFAKADNFKAKGVDLIACVAVNDAFVLKAWADSVGIDREKLLVLSDGNRRFTDAMGVACDLSDKPVGLGVRSRRYSLLAEDGVVKVLNLEEGGAFTISGAEEMLKGL